MQYSSKFFSSGAALPRLAMMNSFAGFGRCSTTISLPVISTLQVQVCPIPTAILSNHLAYSKCSKVDYTPYVRDYIGAWREQGFTFDGLYCGFLGNAELVKIAKEFVRDFNPSVFLLDPVMGDNGRRYTSVTEEHCEGLKELAKCASILTPNLFEACLLTDTAFHSGDADGNTNWGEDELDELFAKLTALCPGKIVVTGLERDDCFVNYVLDRAETLPVGEPSDNALPRYRKSICKTPKAGAPHHGTGDLFASILIADALYGRDFEKSVQKASDFVARCIRGTEEVGAPEIDGVLFEKYLHELAGSF